MIALTQCTHTHTVATASAEQESVPPGSFVLNTRFEPKLIVDEALWPESVRLIEALGVVKDCPVVLEDS